MLSIAKFVWDLKTLLKYDISGLYVKNLSYEPYAANYNKPPFYIFLFIFLFNITC